MLTTPHKHPEKWKQVFGNPCCVGMDIAPIKIEEVTRYENSGLCIWTKEKRTFPNSYTVAISDNRWYLFANTTYKLTMPYIEIPEDCWGIIIPRSTAIRMGMFFSPSASWDPGYKGNGVCLVHCTLPVHLEVGVEIATLVLWKEDGMIKYNGIYQENKHLNNTEKRVN